MKKFFRIMALIFAIVSVLAFASCAKKTAETENTNVTDSQPVELDEAMHAFECKYSTSKSIADTRIQFDYAAVEVRKNVSERENPDNTERLENKIDGYILEERMYLPMQKFCEAMGCSAEYNETENNARVTKNGVTVIMETIIRDDAVYVKARTFESLNFFVNYDVIEDDQMCRITIDALKTE